MTRERGSSAESKNCGFLFLPTADRCFDTKVTCDQASLTFFVTVERYLPAATKNMRDAWSQVNTKVKCPTGRASFWVKFPTVRSLPRVKCPGIARGGMGGFGIDWYISADCARPFKPWPNGTASSRKWTQVQLAWRLALGGQTDSQVSSGSTRESQKKAF